MWDRQAPLQLHDYWICNWTTFVATNKKSARMCVHEGKDIVSRVIKRNGRWDDCNILPKLWRETETIRGATDQPIYVEIGANIGACVMEMLLSTDAPIVAFEPHPHNQFCLTSTLMGLPQEQRDRVSLFPIALGSEQGSSIINAAVGNMGNSVVGISIQDTGNQIFYPPVPIQIERLDTIFNTDSNSWNIPLMKMDAQGFECRILDGMADVFGHIATISSELAYKWLVGQGCSDVGMLDRLRAASFGISLAKGMQLIPLPGKPPKQGIFDIVAKNNHWHQEKK